MRIRWFCTYELQTQINVADCVRTRPALADACNQAFLLLKSLYLPAHQPLLGSPIHKFLILFATPDLLRDTRRINPLSVIGDEQLNALLLPGLGRESYRLIHNPAIRDVGKYEIIPHDLIRCVVYLVDDFGDDARAYSTTAFTNRRPSSVSIRQIKSTTVLMLSPCITVLTPCFALISWDIRIFVRSRLLRGTAHAEFVHHVLRHFCVVHEFHGIGCPALSATAQIRRISKHFG